MCMRTSGKRHHVGVVTSVAGRLAVKLAGQLIAQLRGVNNGEKMSLYRYYRPADGVLNSNDPLSRTIPPAVLGEVNKGVKLVATNQTRKRGSYLFLTPEEKARVAKYGSVNRVRAAVRQFSSELCKELKENTVRDWVKSYNAELKNKRES